MQSVYVKWIVLALLSVMNFGCTYCYDNPSALKSQLEQHFNHIPKAQFEVFFNLLYSVYSVPNIVLPFFGGILTDRLGPRTMLLIIMVILMCGQTIVALGCTYKNFYLMLLGRILFGLGGETISVSQCTLIANWFPANELAMANGIALSISRLGTTLNNVLSPHISDAYSISFAFWVGDFFCFCSLLFTLVLAYIDKKAEVQVHTFMQSPAETKEHLRIKKNINISTLHKNLSRSFWLIVCGYTCLYAMTGPFGNISTSVFMERDYFKALPSNCSQCGQGVYINDNDCTKISSLCPQDENYAWPLPPLRQNCTIDTSLDQNQCLTSTLPYIIENEINCNNRTWREGEYTKNFCQRKIIAEKKSSLPLGISPYIIAITAPFFGYIVDRVGKRPILALIAQSFLLAEHVMIGFMSSVSVYVPLVLQGLSSCLFSSTLWPAVPYCVEEHHIGTAYGIICAGLNFGLAIVPLLVAMLYNSSGTYLPSTSILFLLIGIIGTISGVYLVVSDFKNGGILHSPCMNVSKQPGGKAENNEEMKK